VLYTFTASGKLLTYTSLRARPSPPGDVQGPMQCIYFVSACRGRRYPLIAYRTHLTDSRC
jgi:hypothetical protein